MFTGIFMAVIALILLIVNYYQLVGTVGVEVIAISLLAVLLSSALLQDSVIPPPGLPTYQRLAAAIYRSAEDLGDDRKEVKKDLKNQLDKIQTLINEQMPEFKEKDLVFGIALSVLRKVDLVRARLLAGSKTGFPPETLGTFKSGLQALADMIFSSKNINSRDVETIVDTVEANLGVIPLPPPTPLLSQLSGWAGNLTNLQTFAIELIVALFGSVLVGVIYRVDVPETLAVFFSLTVFIFEVERRFRKRAQ